MSDLDESRRHGVPIEIESTHPHPRQRQQLLSTVNENQSLLSNGCHSGAEYTMQQQQQQQHSSLPSACHVPQHQIQQPDDRIQPEPEAIIADTKDLDGEMSGLQAAAAKTALLIHGATTRSSLDDEVVVVTTEDEEEDDDQSSSSPHRIFSTKHVGFSLLKDTTARHPDLNNGQHYGNGFSGSVHHQQSTTRHAKSMPALAPLMESSTLPNNDSTLTLDDTTEKANLIRQLHSLRQQRKQLQKQISPTLNQHLNEWNFRLSSTQQSHQTALSTLESVSARRIWAEEEYQLSCKWHVLGDVFFIWHRGPFGTINGFRLGKSATTMTGLVKKCSGGSGGGGAGHRNNGGGQPSRNGGGGGGSLFSWGASSENRAAAAAQKSSRQTNHANKNNNGNNASNYPNNATPERVLIPWNEINSALGQAVFLLHTLQNAPHSGIRFRKHVLQPCGSASKIGILKKGLSSNDSAGHRPRTERRRITALAAYYNTGTGTPSSSSSSSSPTKSKQSQQQSSSTTASAAPLPGEVTWYNLHHYEENGSLLSMGYYARRNFNTALEGLLHCIAEALLVVEKRDMALAAPYIMRVDGLVVGKDLHGAEGAGLAAGSGVGGGGGSGGNVKDGEASVGGLPLAYDPAAGEQWTMVCKYLVTNLKWLIAYAAKHVDR